MFKYRFKLEINSYLKSDIWRMLMASIPKQMVGTIESTFKEVDYS